MIGGEKTAFEDAHLLLPHDYPLPVPGILLPTAIAIAIAPCYPRTHSPFGPPWLQMAESGSPARLCEGLAPEL